MTRTLYDLAAADGTRFSPYCWRVKLALAHKRLDYETVPWHFTEKAAIAASGQGKVPVLVDGARIVSDSQTIAAYLEQTYPNSPALFGDAQTQALTLFIKDWTETILHPAIAATVLGDIYRCLCPEDQPYFRETREAAFNRSIEDIDANRQQAEAHLHAMLKPLQKRLSAQTFIAGDSPSWADHLVFGALQWGKLVSATPLLAQDDSISIWMDKVLSTYNLQTV